METNVLKFEMQQPNHIISLATSAVLVSVDVNVWSATKQDRGISDEVTHAKKADSSAGRFVKNLLADDQFHKRVSNYRNNMTNPVSCAFIRLGEEPDDVEERGSGYNPWSVISINRCIDVHI